MANPLTHAWSAFRSLVGPDAAPAKPAALLREDIRDEDHWHVTGTESVATGLDPARLARVWRDADNGDTRQGLTLAFEMERRDMHYHAAITQRRTVVSQLEPEVTPVDDSPLQQRIAADVRALVEDDRFSRLVFHMLDANPKGFSLVEVMWETSESQWWPSRYEWRDQRLFRVDPVTLRGYRFDDMTAEGRALPAHKYVIHEAMLCSGPPLQSGLARVCAAAYLCKSYTVRDLMRFLEVYGIPARVAKYPTESTDAYQRKLLNTLRQMGTDAAAVIPANVTLEWLDSQKGGESGAFLGSAEFWDRQVSKAVLGQTSSIEGSGGDYKASLSHKGVRMDIAAHDARQVMATISEQLIEPFVAFNYGPQDSYPRVRLPVPMPEDLTKFAAAVTPFIDRGLPVARRGIYTRLGLAEPQHDDDLLEPRVVGVGGEAPSGDAPGQTDFVPEPDDESEPTEKPRA